MQLRSCFLVNLGTKLRNSYVATLFSSKVISMYDILYSHRNNFMRILRSYVATLYFMPEIAKRSQKQGDSSYVTENYYVANQCYYVAGDV